MKIVFLGLVPDDDVVARHKRGSRLEVVHQGLILKLPLETTRVTDAIPRFDADKGSFLAIGTPEGYNRRAELDSNLWFAILP